MTSALREVPTRARPKVAIIGGGRPETPIPWREPGWEFWGLNDLHGRFRTAPSLWFEIHQRGTPGLTDKDVLQIRELGCPVFMAAREPDVPRSIPYPEGLSRSGPMTCTFCYAMAWAIECRPEVIGLWGIDLDGSAREQTVERMGLWYWIGMARGRGIQVIGEQDGFRYPHRYGIDYWEEVEWAREVVDRLRTTLEQAHVDDVPAARPDDPVFSWTPTTSTTHTTTVFRKTSEPAAPRPA